MINWKFIVFISKFMNHIFYEHQVVWHLQINHFSNNQKTLANRIIFCTEHHPLVSGTCIFFLILNHCVVKSIRHSIDSTKHKNNIDIHSFQIIGSCHSNLMNSKTNAIQQPTFFRCFILYLIKQSSVFFKRTRLIVSLKFLSRPR